jgi:hypothetical protein
MIAPISAPRIYDLESLSALVIADDCHGMPNVVRRPDDIINFAATKTHQALCRAHPDNDGIALGEFALYLVEIVEIDSQPGVEPEIGRPRLQRSAGATAYLRTVREIPF